MNAKLPPSLGEPPLGRARIGLVGLAVLASGVAVMVHEVVWLRAARRLLGADAASIALTLAVVLAGFAIGARIAARLSAENDARRVLTTYAVLEIAAAIWSAAIPSAAAGLLGVTAWLYRSLGPGPGLDVASALVVAPLLLVPATLAGAALPLAAGALGTGRRATRLVALLYAVHALGGAGGALLAAFSLLPFHGIPTTALVGAGAQIAAAVFAFIAYIYTRPSGVEATPSPDSALADAHAGSGRTDRRKHARKDAKDPAGSARSEDERPSAPSSAEPERGASSKGVGAPRISPWLAGAAALAGVASLALQGLWTRLGALALGPTAESFAIVAALHVLALALGAAIAAPFCARVRAPAAWAAVLLAVAAAATLGGIGSLGDLPARAEAVFRAEPDWLALAWLVAPVVVLPVGAMAASFTLLLSAARADRSPGRAAGVLLAASSAGNVLGAALPLFLVPYRGLAGALIACGLLLLVAAVLAVVPSLRGGPDVLPAAPRQAVAFAAAVALALVLAAVAPERFDPARLASGPYLYAAAGAIPSGRVVFAEDGPEASVVVREGGGDRTLQIDGKVDGSAVGDARTQTLVGLLPALLPEHPSDALIIGLGTGMTADAVRAVPGVRRIEVAELVGPVVRAARLFHDVTDRVLDDRRVIVLPVDGARHLRAPSHTYDVIVSEPSNPWVAGMSDLFALETFTAARDALRPGGVAAFWFHGYATTDAIARDVVRTFRHVFADATLWEIVPGQDYVLLGHRGRATLDLDRIARRVAHPEIRRRLERAGIEDATALLSRLALSGDAIDRFAGPGPLLEARDGRLELLAPRAIRNDASLALLRRLGAIPADEALANLVVDGSSEGGIRLRHALEAGRLVRRMIRSAVARDETRAIRDGERAVGLVDGDRLTRTLLARVLLGRAKSHAVALERVPARDVLFSVLELEPDAAERVEALRTLGDLEGQLHRWDRALERYVQAIRLAPTDLELHRAAATCYTRLGATDAARRELEIIRGLVRARQRQ
ncbi:MAG: hypothetical protein IT379_31205 [Deltaproteobacteria bacterium]|nr:hypothetical protein [Deltaproteobacteria bacterium]